jgi:maleate cis-trans isomerase
MTQNFELELETVTLTPTEMGISGRISKQAIDEAMISLVNDTQAGLALAMADKEDQDILTAIMATSVSGGPKYVNAKKDATTFTSGDYTTAFAGAAITGVTAADVLDLSVIVEGDVSSIKWI